MLFLGFEDSRRCDQKVRKVTMVFNGAVTVSRIVHISKIAKILIPLCSEIHIIFGTSEENVSLNIRNKKVKVYEVSAAPVFKTKVFPVRIVNFLKQNLINGIFLFKLSGSNNIALFLGLYQPVSFLLAKLAGIKTVLFCGGLDIGSTEEREKFLAYMFLSIRWAIQRIIIRFFDKIIVENPSVTKFFNLERYKTKICDDGHLFVDLSHFKIINPLNSRKPIIAYIGALSREKGILNFVKAALISLKKRKDIKFIIIGDGVLRDNIEEIVRLSQLEDNIKIVGWMKYSNIPQCLNTAKLVVVPSYSEGLPNLLVEAMACGTPVLATPVGAISDVVKDGKTGFLLNSNDPTHIAKRVTALLDNTELLEEVSINAYKYVRESFSYEKTLRVWQKILTEVCLL